MDDFTVGATASKLRALEEENEALRKKLEYALYSRKLLMKPEMLLLKLVESLDTLKKENFSSFNIAMDFEWRRLRGALKEMHFFIEDLGYYGDVERAESAAQELIDRLDNSGDW